MRKKLIIAAATLQVLVLAYMAGEREWVRQTGQNIFLRTAPIDPRDAMRGDYVRLNYAISSVPSSRCVGFPELTNGTAENLPPDTRDAARKTPRRLRRRTPARVLALRRANDCGILRENRVCARRPRFAGCPVNAACETG